MAELFGLDTAMETGSVSWTRETALNKTRQGQALSECTKIRDIGCVQVENVAELAFNQGVTMWTLLSQR